MGELTPPKKKILDGKRKIHKENFNIESKKRPFFTGNMDDGLVNCKSLIIIDIYVKVNIVFLVPGAIGVNQKKIKFHCIHDVQEAEATSRKCYREIGIK